MDAFVYAWLGFFRQNLATCALMVVARNSNRGIVGWKGAALIKISTRAKKSEMQYRGIGCMCLTSMPKKIGTMINCKSIIVSMAPSFFFGIFSVWHLKLTRQEVKNKPRCFQRGLRELGVM